MRRAVARLPARGLVVEFEVEDPQTPVPGLADSYEYRLSLDDTVRIQSGNEWGALTALGTLTQLVAEGELEVAEVQDTPHYPWRGVMIDTVRHFISLDTLKRTLEVMAFYKLNVLHLHLTDDQGFRFRSAAYPELASADAYSAADLRELVEYAADRAVRIVPEIDVPGHATSWLAAHPAWGLGDGAVVEPS
ncbi:MAG: family 20 glycosylhydrolase, partial [Gammaproteobacteria bacterium]|nr:family 20 glycosylhydrolase [Gammaproteobacteria bacterium]